MEVKMQTSFIPKKPIIESQARGPGVSLFLLLAIIIFVVASALTFGVWFWQKTLISQIAENQKALADAKKTYEEGTIEDLIRLNDRIEESKGLLGRHLAVSPVFILLEKNVLKNVSLNSMKFSYDESNKIKVNLSGTALSYDVLSKQSDAFGSDDLRPYISEPVISDFSPTTDGHISFNFSALVSPDLVSYKNVSKTIIPTPVSNVNINATTSATSTP